MKAIKKLLALLMAMVMTLALGTTAFASGNISEEPESPYEIYQIFTFESETNGDIAVKWGQNAQLPEGAKVGGDVPNEIRVELEAVNNKSDTEKLEVIKKYVDLEKGAYEAEPSITESDDGKTTTVIYNNLKEGYYLVKNKDGIYDNQENEAYTLYVVRVTEDDTLTFEPKAEVPTLEKEIEDSDPADTNNVAIGDTVPFKLTGTVPSRAADYDYYYYIISDTLDEGLNFNSDSIKVTVTGNGGTKSLAETEDYAVYTGEDAGGNTFQIALVDAKALAGQTITVTYTAVLNEKAKIGETGNNNKANVEYSNNPNEKYDGTQDNENPGKPDSEEKVPLGETPEQETKTYTTGIQIKKIDENDDPLTGAQFRITGEKTNIVLVSQEKFEQITDENFVEDGEDIYYHLTATDTYTKEEPRIKDEYIEAPEGATEGYVKDDTAEGGYRAYDPDNDSGKQLYILLKKNIDEYENTNGTAVQYRKTVVYTQVKTKESVNAEAYVDSDGILTFVGLAAGEYTISETKAPEGYNAISDITVEISFDAAAAEGNKWSATASGVAGGLAKDENDVFVLTVQNLPGGTLPSTGGTGTTLLYTIGGILVVVAGVLLIVKRRMRAGR